ncbi:MAG: hypothetical protein KDD70_18800, partial [Bdellovibrionales bacterium]|nr:hypothetical protein [Bdellovibrionales bacterium]
LAVDDTNGFVYFADIGGIGRPALIAVNLKQRTAKRFEGHPSLDAENVDLRVEGKLLTDPGSGTNRARVALNPITLSANNEMIFFGAMTGTSWYSVPAILFREGRSNKMIADNIHFKGRKPVSDGASTDKLGNHFFTAVNDNAIVALAANGDRVTIAQDRKLIWPDALSFGPDGYLYIAVNQLNRAAPFNGGIEGGKPPYLIARVWTGTDGVSGR